MTANSFYLNTSSLLVEAEEAIWDTKIFDYPVAYVKNIKVFSQCTAANDFKQFSQWISSFGFRIVYCRIPCCSLVELMFLEDNQFRFVETVLHPYVDFSSYIVDSDASNDLNILSPSTDQLSDIMSIASQVFTHERYYIDHRLTKSDSNKRYAQWISNSYCDPNQNISILMRGDDIVSFFVWERRSNNSIYWHLTAVSPSFQGKGFGRLSWITMINKHYQDEAASLSTTISVNNVPVLNLYSSLRFRFSLPYATLHWVK